MEHRSILWAGLTTALAAGCGIVVLDRPEAASGGAGGSGGGPSGSMAVTSSSAASSSNMANSSSASGGLVCNHTTEHLTFQLVAPGGEMYACGASTGSVSFDAVVTASDTSLTLSPCTPNVQSEMPPAKLAITAVSLYAKIPPGTYVTVESDVEAASWGCSMAILIQNLPSFGGVPNPESTKSFVWIAGGDGTLSTFPDSPFTVADGPGCGLPDPPGITDQKILVTPAGVNGIALPEGASYAGPGQTGESWFVQNLRSYKTPGAPASEDEKDFAYWVMRATPWM